MLKIPCICDCDKNIFRLHLASQQRNFPIETRRNRQILSNVLVIINIQQIAVCCEATIVCPNVYIACDRWGGGAVPPAWDRDEPANVCRQCRHIAAADPAKLPGRVGAPYLSTIQTEGGCTNPNHWYWGDPSWDLGFQLFKSAGSRWRCEVWSFVIIVSHCSSSAHTLWPSGFWVGIRYVTRCG